MARNYKGIIKAIRSGRLNCDKHSGTRFTWYGRLLEIQPYYVSYGQGGYTIRDLALKTKLQYDFDTQPTFEVLDENDNTVYSE